MEMIDGVRELVYRQYEEMKLADKKNSLGFETDFVSQQMSNDYILGLGSQ